jgi:hypothetical protein
MTSTMSSSDAQPVARTLTYPLSIRPAVTQSGRRLAKTTNGGSEIADDAAHVDSSVPSGKLDDSQQGLRCVPVKMSEAAGKEQPLFGKNLMRSRIGFVLRGL